LDLGSENGSNIKLVLDGTGAEPKNVYIADINEAAVRDGAASYGFVAVPIDESQKLPFPDKFFDIVYCSSVIEHVTAPKDKVWSLYSEKRFQSYARKHQKQFADEIKRLGRQYFVQCPYKHFPIESHSWLPFVAWMPRWIQIPLLKFTNTFWIKRTNPDWYLLNKRELMELFEGAELVEEQSLGLTKSIMAVHTDRKAN
jgi:SAM-dependent methyltransferase